MKKNCCRCAHFVWVGHTIGCALTVFFPKSTEDLTIFKVKEICRKAEECQGYKEK